ncbi:NAD(P)-dependent oxidoreductase [Nereida sp. MMG025]|uniref:NAD(P)-dependent oxidoreductase n=1 Tax=Nereida sp. MMG025 TaxID=2909981 RepID=UPI001F1CB7E9|nr:NAD(P)-binding oxidoreductase [Nereida sp. MMG025]MCF6446038.1 SDR family oxidoreductase [Nereida sp. MMG025]
MKVLVVGATGNIGRLTLKAVAEAGHEVTAFGRSVDRIEPFEGLTIEKGDVTSATDLARAIPGHDAVILTFGAPLNRETIFRGTNVCETGTRNVVDAMKAAGVPRLVAMTSIGAGDSSGHGSWPFRNLIKPILLGRIMKDRTAQEDVVRQSGLPEWVIVRPSELTDNDRRDDLREIISFAGQPEPSSVARASVAAYLAKKTTDKSHDGQAVVISN